MPQFEFGRPDELILLSKELIGSTLPRRIAIGAATLMMVAAISFAVVHHQRATRQQNGPPQNASINFKSASKPIAPQQEQAPPTEAAHREPHRKKGIFASRTNPAATTPAPPVSTSTDNTDSEGTSPRGKYSIVVNDAMRRDDADEIASRLRDLGYTAYLLPTDKNGETSWMVKVGPYQTAAEATAAQQELNKKYRDAYPPSQ
jgi:cell division septation protein DedD